LKHADGAPVMDRPDPITPLVVALAAALGAVLAVLAATAAGYM
jgi:hypothetical protein